MQKYWMVMTFNPERAHGKLYQKEFVNNESLARSIAARNPKSVVLPVVIEKGFGRLRYSYV